MSFRLEIVDVFRIAGRGTVATGVLEGAELRVGDALRIETQRGEVTATVGGIEMRRRLQDVAQPGQEIGVLLADLTGEIGRGDVIRPADDRRDPAGPGAEPAATLDTLTFPGRLGGGPVLLLPLRIETAFDETRLRIRAFPDTLHIASDEAAITEAEHRLVQEFNAARARGEDGQVLRETLDATLGAGRAGYVLEEVAAGRGPSARIPVSGARAVARCLPQRLIAVGLRDKDIIATSEGREIPRRLPVGPAPGDLALFGQTGPSEIRWMEDYEAARQIGMAIDLTLPDRDGFDRLLVFGLGPDAARDPDEITALLAAHGRRGTGITTPEPGQPTKGGRGLRPSAPRDGTGSGRLVQALALRGRPPMQDSPQDGAMVEALGAVIFEAALRPALQVLLDPDDAIAIGETSPALENAKKRYLSLRPDGHLPLMRIGDDPFGIHLAALDPPDRQGFDPAAAIRAVQAPLAAHARTLQRAEAQADGYLPAISAFSRHDIGQVWRARTFLPPDQVLDILCNLAPDRVRTAAADGAFQAISARLAQINAARGRPGPAAAANGALFDQYAAQFCGDLVGRGAWASTEVRLDDPDIADLQAGEPLWRRLEARLAGRENGPRHGRPMSLLAIFAEHLIVRCLAEIEAAAQSPDPAERARLLGHGSFLRPEDGLPVLKLAVQAAQRLGQSSLRDLAAAARRQHRQPGHALAQLSALPDLLDRIADHPPRRLHRTMAGLLDALSTRADVWEAFDAHSLLVDQRVKGDATLSVGGFGLIEGPLHAGAGRGGNDPRYIAAPTPTLGTVLAILWRAQTGLAWHDPDADALIPADLSGPAIAAARPLIDALRRGDDLVDTLSGHVTDHLQRDRAADAEDLLVRVYPLPEAEATASGARFDAVAFLDDADLRLWDVARFGPLPDAVQRAHASLRGAVDALRQVLLAEGAAALAEARPDAAAAALAGLGAGAAPPDDFVVTEPRATGPSVPLSVTLLTDWTEDARATDFRALLAPELAAFAEALMGGIEGNVIAGFANRIPLASLVGSSLDLAWIMAPGRDGRRILRDAAARRAGLGERVDLGFDRAAEDTLWMAERVHATLSQRRTLTPGDLGEREPEGWRAAAVAEVLAQTRSRIQKWQNQARRLEGRMERPFGRPIPSLDRILGNFGAGAGLSGLRDLQVTFAQRLSEAAAADTPEAALQALLGDLPMVLPVPLRSKAGLTATSDSRFKHAGPAALSHWIEQSATVREALEPLSDLVLSSDVEMRAVQWSDGALRPPRAEEDWLGGPMTEDDVYLAEGSSVVIGTVSDGPGRVAGLVLDAWSETLPARMQVTTVLLDIDAPRARAPHTAILGVRPDPDTPWRPTDVLRLLDQAVDAAQLRTLGLGDLPGVDTVAAPGGDLGATLPLLMIEQGIADVRAGFCAPRAEPDL